MEIEFICPECKTRNQLETTDLVCAHCGKHFEPASAFSTESSGIQHCGICGCRDLYIQKDFNRKVGCAIAAIGAILAPFTKFLSLLICALIDLALYYSLPMITICYRCGSIYREFAKNPAHEPFNLGINDRYRASER